MTEKKDFCETLKMLEYGKLNDDLTEQFPELVKKVQEHQAKGSVTLKIEVIPEGEGQYRVVCDLAVKEPKPPRGKSLMFGTPEGNLQHSPYNQGELPVDEPQFDESPGEVLETKGDNVTPIKTPGQ